MNRNNVEEIKTGKKEGEERGDWESTGVWSNYMNLKTNN